MDVIVPQFGLDPEQMLQSPYNAAHYKLIPEFELMNSKVNKPLIQLMLSWLITCYFHLSQDMLRFELNLNNVSCWPHVCFNNLQI